MADDELTVKESTRSEEALVPSFVNESDDEEDEVKEKDYPFLFDVPSANNSPPLSPRQASNTDENISDVVDRNILHSNEATTNDIVNNSDNNPSSNQDSSSIGNDNNTETNNAETTSAQQPTTTAAPHTLNKRHRVKIHHPSSQPSASWSTWFTSNEGQRSLVEIIGVGIIAFVLFRVWWRQRSIAYDSLLLWLEKYTEVQRHAMLLQMSREEVVTTLWKTSSDTLLNIKEHSHHLWQLQKQPSSLKQTVVTAAVTSAAASVASTIASSGLSETQPVGVDTSLTDKTPVSSSPTEEQDRSSASTDPQHTQQEPQTEKKLGSQVAVRSVVSPVTWLVQMPFSVMHTLTHMVDYVLRQCIWESLFG